jgi:hypothetical protein
MSDLIYYINKSLYWFRINYIFLLEYELKKCNFFNRPFSFYLPLYLLTYLKRRSCSACYGIAARLGWRRKHAPNSCTPWRRMARKCVIAAT